MSFPLAIYLTGICLVKSSRRLLIFWPDWKLFNMAAAVIKPFSDAVYVLKDLENEKEVECKRLTTQYHLLKGRIGRTSPVPPTIDLSSVNAVLDVGAGNCVWILDVAAQKDITDRVRFSGHEQNVELYACDINLGKFPTVEETEKRGIKVFEQDVTSPFPKHMHEKFDLIHMSALAGALSETQWKNALQNLRNALSELAVIFTVKSLY